MSAVSGGGVAATMLQGVKWHPTNVQDDGSGIPFATHAGVLEVAGHLLRCYRLNDGRAIFHADDAQDFLSAIAAREARS